MTKLTYNDYRVDISANTRWVAGIEATMQSTYGPWVCRDRHEGFAELFRRHGNRLAEKDDTLPAPEFSGPRQGALDRTANLPASCLSLILEDRERGSGGVVIVPKDGSR